MGVRRAGLVLEGHSVLAAMAGRQRCNSVIAAAAVCLLISLVAAQPRPPQGGGPRGPGGQHHRYWQINCEMMQLSDLMCRKIASAG